MFLWVLCISQGGLAQSPQREVVRVSADEFTLQYSFLSDSLKGFFMLTEEFSGKAKLLKAHCKLPYHFKEGRLQVSGEKIPVGMVIDFSFKMLEKNISLNGIFKSENFGHTAYEQTFKAIRLEIPEPLLASESLQPVMTHRELQKGEMYSPINNNNMGISQSNTSPANHQQPPKTTTHHSPAMPDTVYPISFRVQLAASTVPMDPVKLSKLTGLNLPVYEDRIDSFYKYTIGNETSIQDAQALLNRMITVHFKKPFIVAYREKNRITVQEAVGQINKQP